MAVRYTRTVRSQLPLMMTVAAADTPLLENQHVLDLTASLRVMSGHLAGDIGAAVDRRAAQRPHANRPRRRFQAGPAARAAHHQRRRAVRQGFRGRGHRAPLTRPPGSGTVIGGVIGRIAPVLTIAIGDLIGGGAGEVARARKGRAAAEAVILAGAAEVDRLFRVGRAYAMVSYQHRATGLKYRPQHPVIAGGSWTFIGRSS